MPQAYIIIDQNHRIRYTDTLSERELGPCGGRRCHDYLFGRSSACECCPMSSSLANGRTVIQQRTFAGPPVREVEITTVPFGREDEDGLILHMVSDPGLRSRAIEEESLRFLAEHGREIIYRVRFKPDYRFEYMSPAVSTVLGYRPEDFYADPTLNLQLIHPEDRKTAENTRADPAGSAAPVTVRFRHRDGHYVWIERQNVPFFDHAGELAGVIGIGRDVTEVEQKKRELRENEQKLLQSQRLESMGRMAGGVAHDFNNFLTAMLGYLDLIRADPDSREIVLEGVAEIGAAIRRAADLTQRLLAFGKKQVMRPQLVRIDSLVSDLDGMLRRLIREDIEIVYDVHPGTGCVLADPGQLEQVLVNLCVNAADAMPWGGRLELRSRRTVLDGTRTDLLPKTRPGEYVELTVVDTGHGMEEETTSHIFDPFFTTKDTRGGTGLGLSIVYGIVKQSGGCIRVKSTVGRGTEISIYLPAATGE